jgi:hypothetical protein
MYMIAEEGKKRKGEKAERDRGKNETFPWPVHTKKMNERKKLSRSVSFFPLFYSTESS